MNNFEVVSLFSDETKNNLFLTWKEQGIKKGFFKNSEEAKDYFNRELGNDYLKIIKELLEGD